VAREQVILDAEGESCGHVPGQIAVALSDDRKVIYAGRFLRHESFEMIEQFKKRPCRSGLYDSQWATVLDVSISFAYW
jgi:hypothetical protein